MPIDIFEKRVELYMRRLDSDGKISAADLVRKYGITQLGIMILKYDINEFLEEVYNEYR